ncbi:hypothetical protein Tco_0565275 [Tanacetum coccineum]
MDTKLLSALESNNTLARCWFKRNVPVTTFGSWWAFLSLSKYALPLLPVAGPLFLQFLGKASSIPTVFSWGGSISPDSFLPSILLLLVIIVAVAIVVTVVLVVVVGEGIFLPKIKALKRNIFLHTSGRKKSWGSNSGNIGDGGKTVGGALGACGGGIDKSSEGSGEAFPDEARE